MMWNGIKLGKVGTINIKSLKMLSLSCELILYYARKTVPWHYQDNDVSRVAFGCCVCRILSLRALVHCSVVVLLVRTVFTCDCLYTCMYHCTLPAHYFLSPFFFLSFFFFRVRSVHCLASPSRHVRRRLTRRYLAGRPR
jgi:hypothetical protein